MHLDTFWQKSVVKDFVSSHPTKQTSPAIKRDVMLLWYYDIMVLWNYGKMIL